MKKYLLPFLIIVLGVVIWYVVAGQLTSSKNLPTIQNKNESSRPINNSGYYKSVDGSTIYFIKKDAVLPDADLSTFSILAHNVSKDARHVYVENRIQNGLDAGSFVRFNLETDRYLYVSFFRDKNGFYYLEAKNGTGDNLSITSVPFDLSKIEFVGDYLKTLDGIYMVGSDSFVKINGADPETFRILGTCYAVERSRSDYMIDKNHVYVGSTIVPDADPETFAFVASINSGPDDEVPFSMKLWKDKSHIYAHCGKPIVEADYATFEYLGNNRAQDKNNFYSFNTGGGYDVKSRK